MRISSVRLRLTLSNIAILAIVLSGFLLTVHVSVRGYLVSAMDRQLQETSDRWASVAIANFETIRHMTPETERRESARSRYRGNRRDRMARLFNPRGRLMASLPMTTIQTHPETPPWDSAAFDRALSGKTSFSMVTDSDGTPLRVYSRGIMLNGRPSAVIQVAASFAEVKDLLQHLTLTLLALAPAALIIAGLAGLFITNRALKPVRQIVDTANSLNTDDLSRRIPVLGSDEFAHLANTINNLLERVDKMLAQLKQAIERERRFTADASHELRTPLTAIKANATLALHGKRTPAEYKEALQIVDQSADIMNRLVQDMLLLARTDSGQLPLNFTAIDPHDLFRESAALVAHNDADAPLIIEVSDPAGTILGDADHLRRLLANLLENAFRHTPTNGKVMLESRAQEDRVILTVTDTGEGIAPKHLPHLGERFYRVDASRSRERGGTGLGLAICKSIVDAHHGWMDIDSTLGKGTRVTVLLPSASRREDLEKQG